LKTWRVWCKALGEKAFEENNEADKVAIIRTILILQAIITNLVIISGVIKHWFD